jgi:hypothetical protein
LQPVLPSCAYGSDTVVILSFSFKLYRNHALRLYTSFRFGADTLGVSTAKGS